MKMSSYKPSGFTLVEIAIVLVVISLLLGGMMMPLSMQLDQRRNSETQKALEEINQALIGFAIVRGYFPCPAVSATAGAEDRTATTCTGGKRDGFIPWVELGVSGSDAWGRLFRYSVTPDFSDSGTKFMLSSVGDIDIKDTTAGANIASNVPVVVMSHGKNGYLGTTIGNTAIANPSASNTDEQTNAPPSAGTTFISKPMTENIAAAGGEFDDLVTWISPNILFNRMVAAGKLP